MSKKQITIPVFIPHSGCPHCCVFCNQWRVTGLSEKVTSDSVHKTIELYLSAAADTIGKVEIAFFGGSFTAIPQIEQIEYLRSVKPYIENGVIESVRVSTRPDYINRNILDVLKSYHVKTIELGVQSFSDRVLTASGRGHNSQHVIDAISLLKEYGFRVGIQLMPGLPEDDYETSIQSAAKAVELFPDDVRIYPAVVLKDTEMEVLYNKKKFVPLTIEEAVDRCSIMYEMFIEKEINVIRMGLHPMDLSGGTVVAGPYHEALGFLIKSRYRRGILEKVIKNAAGNNLGSGVLSIILPDKMKEEYIGMKRENISYLKDKFRLLKLDYTYGNIDEPQILY
jgi:histone acetyltransferase (RNA polymerase elongator complex component)